LHRNVPFFTAPFFAFPPIARSPPWTTRTAPDLIVTDKQLAADDMYSLKAAVLTNGTHILLGPPPGTLKPSEPTTEKEELTIQMAGESVTHKVKVEKNIYFDVRILNK